MDLKHIEELAKDKDLLDAYFVNCLMDVEVDEDNYDIEDFEYGLPKVWDDLTETEKISMLESAKYFWLKDCSNHSIAQVCYVAMLHQYEVLEDKLDKWEFMDLLVQECD